MDEYKNRNDTSVWRNRYVGGRAACGIMVHLYLLAYSQRADVAVVAYQLPALSISMFFSFNDHSMKKPYRSSRFTSPSKPMWYDSLPLTPAEHWFRILPPPPPPSSPMNLSCWDIEEKPQPFAGQPSVSLAIKIVAQWCRVVGAPNH